MPVLLLPITLEIYNTLGLQINVQIVIIFRVRVVFYVAYWYSIAPPGQSRRSPFFFVFPFPFCHSPFSPSFSFAFSLCRFALVSRTVYHLRFLFSLPCSPCWRILLFCLGATPPPRCLRACEVCVFPLRGVFFFFVFSSFPLFFCRFRFGRR